MNIDYPTQEQIKELKKLWQEAFGDTDAFWEQFYTHGFAPDRCRCMSLDGKPVAALYWFDCLLEGRPVAYLYGIATAKRHRGKGLCRALLENTHTHLKYLGYAGEILVPAQEELFPMYEKMGYTHTVSIQEYSVAAGQEKAELRPIGPEEFCRLRQTFLPDGGVVQDGDGIAFLETQAEFYAGEDFLVTASREENFLPELLGNAEKAPQILAALGMPEARIRTIGAEKPFAMYHALSELPAPGYFGLAFD